MSFVLAALSFLALAQPAAVPPPVEQANADCARMVYASDTLVCGDAALRTLDAQLAELVRRDPLTGTMLIESDTAWFTRRSRCAFATDHRACLAAAYEERLTVRVALGSSPETEGKVANCKGTEPLQGVLLSSISDAPILLIRDAASGKGIGVALPPAAKDAAWQAFASVTRKGKGKRMSIATLSGNTWQCPARSDPSGVGADQPGLGLQHYALAFDEPRGE